MDGPDVVALVMMFGIFLLVAATLGFMAGSHVRDTPSRWWEEDDDDEPDDIVDGVIEDRDSVALPLDPDNPPTWRIARVDRPDVECSCHGLPVRAGERLLFWPMGDGVMRVYHEDATEAAGQ